MDVNVRAFRTVQEALREDKCVVSGKKVAGKKGGSIGGRARANSLSKERRVEIAKKASAARWGEHSLHE